MQDIKVTVYDGKHHPVDSKEIAFVQAGKKAFLDAIDKAAPILMEPVVGVTITVPNRCAGGVTGDLSAMHGMVSGTEALDDNRIVVSGQVPLKEMQEYHSRLKSLTGGDGSSITINATMSLCGETYLSTLNRSFRSRTLCPRELSTGSATRLVLTTRLPM